MAIRAITLDSSWEQFMNFAAPRFHALAAFAAQGHLQRKTLDDLQRNSEKVRPHANTDKSQDGVEFWKLFVGVYEGHKAYAVWSVKMPDATDFRLYSLDFEKLPIDTEHS